MASRNRPKERQQIGFVCPGQETELTTQLPLPELMEQLQPMLAESQYPVYLVGGTVRDALLGRAGGHDLDFAVSGDAVELARSLADALNGAFYLMDAERGTARVILEDATLDLARFRGKDLVEDLRDRDFTVNAIALPADQATIDAIIDPLDGQNDLAAGLIRATGPNAIHRDPVRGLRAVRQAAELDLKILPETADLIRASAKRLWTISAERVRDEVVRILAAPGPADSLRTLDDLNLLPEIFPELVTTKGVAQPLPHQVDVFEHTMLLVEKLEALLDSVASCSRADNQPLAMAQEALTPFSAALQAHLSRTTVGGRIGRTLLFLGAVLHDVGKPGCRTVEADGRIRFLGHEELGTKIGQRRAQELALSNNEVRQVATIVRHHMRPAWLARSSSDGRPTRRSIYRFFRDTGTNGMDICLVCLADGLSTGTLPDPIDWERRLRSVGALLEHYLNHHTETISPPPLIDGRQLIRALDIPAGPVVGRLLELIREAQAAGEVSTLAGALALAREAQKDLTEGNR
jgi:tRNA nucleotidyltransferase/poly(A) polymerase